MYTHWLLFLSVLVGLSECRAKSLQIREKPLTPDQDRDATRVLEWQASLATSIGQTPLRNDDSYHLDGLMSRSDITREFRQALSVMQETFFEVWLGRWPEAIDWTAAVLGTYVSSSLHSLSKSSIKNSTFFENGDVTLEDRFANENEINKYFLHVSSYYFVEDAFSIRQQAYDDMQWVVLGWLEAVKFISSHNDRIRQNHSVLEGASDSRAGSASWHGTQLTPAFAHRANVFYDLVYRAYDPILCAGGLTWNPRLKTYKNTITNTLFVSASIGMYLYHPGDDNDSPFLKSQQSSGRTAYSAEPHDRYWLDIAAVTYDWLEQVNLTNERGLYVDGYHLTDESWWNPDFGTHAQCDERNEMVYTYNQGVILSGLRGLWEATGEFDYLSDGHELVRNVVAATGWNQSDVEAGNEEWYGLGTRGILADACDASGRCSQDAQTFKGIFFLHLTEFCRPLPTDQPLFAGSFIASPELAGLHANSCRQYGQWVAHNARAALRTRKDGVFGMWWGAALHGRAEAMQMKSPALHEAATDVHMLEVRKEHLGHEWNEDSDANDRGRGRTVETQGGGLALLRCLWELDHEYGVL